MAREHQFDGSPETLGSDPFGLTALVEGTVKAAAVDPTLQSNDTLMGAAVALELARENLETAHAAVLGRLSVTGATDTAVGMATGAWLAWETDTSPAKCRGRVNTAKRLGWFDEFNTALGDQHVKFRHSEVLASVANPRNRDGLQAAQSVLIEWADRFRFTQWAAMVRQLAADLDQDGSFDPNEDLSRNRLRLRDNGDGTTDIKGVLAGVTAVTITQGLDTLADELFHRYSNDRKQDPNLEIPPRPQLLAEALAHAIRLALSTDIASSRQPRIEATITFGDNPNNNNTHNSSTDSTRSTDVAGVTGVAGDGSGPPPPIRFRDLNGRPIAASTAEALLVDADLRALLLDVAGNPLWLGRTVRLATPAQKTALAVRDGGCIFPGCDMPPHWCDTHHQPNWKPDGTTNIDKMFLGCRHHHGVTHRKGWTCNPDPNRPQHWIWTTPTGRQLHSQRQHHPPP